MKHLFTFALGAALLAALVLLPPASHGVLGALAFLLAWAFDRDVARGLGRPRAWLVAMIVLVALGAWLGPKDVLVGGFEVSRAGALAGVTMAARAIGLLLVTTSVTRAVPPQVLLAKLTGRRGRALGASVVVALRLAPTLASELRRWSDESKRTAPGALRMPLRAFEVLVLGIAHAKTLADQVTTELSLPSSSTPNPSEDRA